MRIITGCPLGPHCDMFIRVTIATQTLHYPYSTTIGHTFVFVYQPIWKHWSPGLRPTVSWGGPPMTRTKLLHPL